MTRFDRVMIMAMTMFLAIALSITQRDEDRRDQQLRYDICAVLDQQGTDSISAADRRLCG